MKYARIERERRFLLEAVPGDLDPTSGFHEIRDRYLTDTGLRLREVRAPDGSPVQFKLTQKLADRDPTRCRITNTYITGDEHRLLSQLPGRCLSKRRHPYMCAGRRFVIDVFRGALEGLVLAEVEAETDAALAEVPIPPFARCEVTADPALTGGALAAAEPTEALARARRLLESP